MPRAVFSPFGEPECDGIPASALLITPVRQKRFDIYETAMNSLWARASDALANADRIVISGYSFPPTDTRAAGLLAYALAAKPGSITVDVVAPDASAIVSRIGPAALVAAKAVTAHDMKFEDYLGVLAKNIPARMRQAAAENDEVREWVERIYAMGQLTNIQQQTAGIALPKGTTS